MKYFLFTLFFSGQLLASTLSMSDLQIIVNEDIVDYFATNIPNIAEPVVADNITKHQLMDNSQKSSAKVRTEVSVKVLNVEAVESFYNDYQCFTTLVDTGKVWRVAQTICQLKEE